MLRLLYALACLGVLQAHPQQQRTDPAIVSVPLREVFENGQQWFVGDIGVGTPGQPMTVIVALHGITMVNSVRCTDPYCTSHSQYDASASSTYQEDGTPVAVPTLNISGVMSADSVTLGGVTVSGLPFGEATSVWNEWSLQAPQDGVLGLCLSTDTAEYSILVSMATQGLIPAMQAGFWLGRGSVGGELTLGGVNEDRYVGELTWTPIVDDMVVADSVTIGDINLCDGGKSCLLGDTAGSPYFFMTMEAAKTVNDALGGIDIGEPGVAALDCATLDSLPDLVTVIEGRAFTMTARQYTFFIPLADGTQMCLSGFVGIPDGPANATMTFGTLFLQQFFTAYDIESMQVGFGESAE